MTVNGAPASLGRAEAPGAAETVGAAEVAGAAEEVDVIGAGPVGVGVVEHATNSAATAHAAATATAARAPLVI